NVGPEQDHRQVFGIDHLGAARHLHDELAQRGSQGEIAEPERAADPRALDLADDVVVRDPAAVRMKRLRLAEKDEMPLAALIDQQYLLAVLEGETVRHAISGRGGGGKKAATGASTGRQAQIQRTVANPE